MKFLIQSFVLLCLYVESFTFPQCCHRPLYYYGDFSIMFKCGISICKSPEETVGSTCFSCIPKASGINQNSVNSLAISKPEVVCQDFFLRGNRDFRRVILSWTATNSSSSVFLIEAMNNFQSNNWGIVGMTNETLAEITHLNFHFQYRFRVTPVLSANTTLLPALSDWIKILDSNNYLSAPSDIKVSQFVVEDDRVKAIVTWNASIEKPCSYKLLWMSSDDKTVLDQMIISLPGENLSSVSPGLFFDKNYTVTIFPSSQDDPKKADSETLWFITPQCLNITNNNFTLCAPGPPRNASVICSASSAVVSWLPPEHTNSNNSIIGYRVYVVKDGKTYVDSLSVDKDTLSVSFAYLNPSEDYVFEVKAKSGGGMGKAAVAQIFITEKLAAIKVATDLPTPYHFIVPFSAVFMVLLFVAVFKLYRKTYKLKGHPSGAADISDHVLPLLISEDKIQLKEVLGKGEFGIVHRGFYMRSKSKDEVAVKIFPAETNVRLKLLHEVEMMFVVGRHDSVIGLHGFTLTLQKMYLILEYCPLGDLHTYLVYLRRKILGMKSLSNAQNKNNITEKTRFYGKRLCSYIYQVAQGMDYIASLKLIHRDVAARNILMSSEEKVKIADFGLSQDVYETEFYYGNGHKKLPIRWMAPEALEKQKFSTYADVWSFGVFMWEIFKLGKVPYSGYTNGQVIEYVLQGSRLQQPHCTKEWYDLMYRCWQPNPKNRPCFKELVERVGEILDRMCLYVPLV